MVMVDRPWSSRTALRLYGRAAVVLLLFLVGTVPLDRGLTDASVDALLHQTARRWCDVHGKRDDLQAVLVDVHFRPEPPLFSEGEGVVVAPVGIDLAGAQRVIEVASRPTHLRKLSAQGMTVLAWEYSGRMHREMRFAGLALVERKPLTRVVLPEKPAFTELTGDLQAEALARAVDLEEHGLPKCAAFPEWARTTSGAPPHTDQVLRLVEAVAQRWEDKEKEPEDLCAAIRERRLTSHRAQVAAVMAAREVGIPAFGFASASERDIFLVGTWVDGLGWILVDVDRPGDGWFSGGPPLLTMAPLLGQFSAGRHGFWYPEGAAYNQGQWGVSEISGTEWRGRLTPDKLPTDTTEARVISLAEACP
jgi:hypothetical protein